MTAIMNGQEQLGAAEDDWRVRGNCRRVNSDVFFPVQTVSRVNEDGTSIDVEIDDEPAYPSPQAKNICHHCPVRVDCLNYALAKDIPYGTFGGMSAYQRGLLLKRRSRQRCPGCGSDDIIRLGHNQVCIACGISWDVAVPIDD